ncbi:unnamed protein product [Spirodela intermedia]|uniref:Uncharacterized protein n=1 Tax=Spirodela intermedia TaxID=51605 RepID=A0A7I8J176_SPIIN|nr:unnamed protein product [Spirodela intermedia]CAA6663898.1 unnamed protein product [Spirodela intermedia]
MERTAGSSAASERLRRRSNAPRASADGLFSASSMAAFLCLTASSPPPLPLLLVPVGIIAVLLLLALMPSDVHDVAACL